MHTDTHTDTCDVCTCRPLSQDYSQHNITTSRMCCTCAYAVEYSLYSAFNRPHFRYSRGVRPMCQ